MDRPIQAIFSWSGGKDSAYALYRVLNEGVYTIRYLLTNVNEKFRRISMHGVREELLDQQAHQLGLPLRKIYLPDYISMAAYDARINEELTKARQEGISHIIFGDIFLEDLRLYREEQCQRAGLIAVFPLWQLNTQTLAQTIYMAGFRAILCCINGNSLDQSFAGRELAPALLADLPPTVDPCGENGEFHTFVYDGPIFRQPIPVVRDIITEYIYEPENDTAPDEDKPVWSHIVFYYQELVPGTD